MRFMVIVKATKASEAGELPDEKMLSEMMKYNEQPTDWRRIAALYGELSRVMRSPIVEVNRAVAVGMAFGPQAGLDIVDALASEPALERYHLLRACARTCSRSWAGATKRGPSSSARRR